MEVAELYTIFPQRSDMLCFCNFWSRSLYRSIQLSIKHLSHTYRSMCFSTTLCVSVSAFSEGSKINENHTLFWTLVAVQLGSTICLMIQWYECADWQLVYVSVSVVSDASSPPSLPRLLSNTRCASCEDDRMEDREEPGRSYGKLSDVCHSRRYND